LRRQHEKARGEGGSESYSEADSNILLMASAAEEGNGQRERQEENKEEGDEGGRQSLKRGRWEPSEASTMQSDAMKAPLHPGVVAPLSSSGPPKEVPDTAKHGNARANPTRHFCLLSSGLSSISSTTSLGASALSSCTSYPPPASASTQC